MTAKPRAYRGRAGFTMVEMLVVIGIIAVLAAISFSVYGKIKKTAQGAQARNDLTNLDAALTKFKQDFGFYPPSHVTIPDPADATKTVVVRFVVPTKISGSGTAQNEASLTVLRRMFPRWNPTDGGSGTGDITPALALAGSALDPNQAMLYFLAGPAALNSALGEPGFNPAAPLVPSGNTKKGPYLEVTPGKVAIPDKDVTGYESGNPTLPNFVDPWGVPYAYFAAGGGGYDGRLFFPFGTTFTPAPGDLALQAKNYSGGTGMRPIRMGNKWVNADKCQLVSAGPNRKFGTGTQSKSTSAPSYDATTDVKPGVTNGYAETDPGEDDLANFNEGASLGTAQ